MYNIPSGNICMLLGDYVTMLYTVYCDLLMTTNGNKVTFPRDFIEISKQMLLNL